METLLAMAIMICQNYYYPNQDKIEECNKQFEICRERQIWGLLDRNFSYEREAKRMEYISFLQCHDEFRVGNQEWE